MYDMVGIIFTGGQKPNMKDLVTKRSISAIPIGGKYRAIDFALSNMANSQIRKVGILTQYSFRSLMDHIGSGKEWDLDRKNAGIFMFIPFLAQGNEGWYKGTADGLVQNLTYLKRSTEKYVVMTSGNCIYSMDYRDVLEAHKKSGADLTVVYKDMSHVEGVDITNYGVVKLDKNERIIDFQEKPKQSSGTLVSLGIYVIERELLIDLLVESDSKAKYDFVKDILIQKLDKLNIKGYRFDDYWRALNSVKMFYRCNMELIQPEISDRLFKDDWRIYTKVKDNTPSKYNEEAIVKESIVADGCIIEGEVYNSVLSRGVVVRKGAVVRNSIIMQDSIIENNVSLENVILDKRVTVKESRGLKGVPNHPVVIGKGETVE